MDITAPGVSRLTGRRRFLSAVGLGGALTALPVAARVASASAPAGSDAAQTSSDTDADAALLGFAQQLELAATGLYETAAEALGGEPADLAAVVDVLKIHHLAYGDILSGTLGRTAPNTPLPAFTEQHATAFGNASQLLAAATELERQLAATHLELLGKISDTGHAKLLSSIMIIEARHVSALTALAGDDPMPTDAAYDSADALDPADFSAEASS